MKLKSILVVDDSSVDLEIVSLACSYLDCEVEKASSASDALAAYKAKRHTLVLTDYIMEPLSGIDLVRQLKDYDPSANCMFMTGYPDSQLVNYIVGNNISTIINKPIKVANLVEQLRLSLNREQGATQPLGGIRLSNQMDVCLPLLGQSAQICRVRKRVAEIINTAKPVLLEGQPGVGKRNIAEFIHQAGNYADSPILTYQCSKHAPKQIDEILNGSSQHPEAPAKNAHKGTIVLDNIERLSLNAQAMLVDNLQALTSKYRLISITDASIDELMAQGRLDEMLYFELCLETLHIPPLSERAEDVEAITRHLMHHSDEFGWGATVPATEQDAIVTRLRRTKLDLNITDLESALRETHQEAIMCR